MPPVTMLESGLFQVLVMLALLPLIVVASRTRRRSRALLLVSLWLIAPVVLTWAALSLRVAPVMEQDVVGRPIEAPTDGYVSSKTCEACHPSQYASWHRSYHRTMTQVATPATILGDFDDVHLEWKGRAYDLSIDDEAAWVELDDPTPEQPGGTRRVKHKVVMSTGSHYDQVYWLDAARDDRLILPFEFYHSRRLDRWLPLEAAYMADVDVHDVSLHPGAWNFVCIGCHATGGAPRFTAAAGPESRVAFDTKVVEFGIACEACHGPAEEHVRRNWNPVHRLSQHLTSVPDGTITNPANLDHKRSSRICGQCHSITVVELDRSAGNRWGFKRNPYRPGMEGPDPVVFIQHRFSDPDYPAAPHERQRHEAILAHLLKDPTLLETSFWSDGMVRISGRDYSAMIDSPCYERGEISCASCHVMHKSQQDVRSLDEWAHHQVVPEMYGNGACTQCHESYEDEKLISHTHHSESSSGSNCYNCHMPYTTYGMLKGIRSHHIASPTAQESVNVGRPNACNLCHLDQTLAWTAEWLEKWYDTERPELSEDERTISAGALWALTGRAGTRALTAYSMGWEPAVSASRSDWMTPILSQLLADPYYAVRYIASQSLKKRIAFADFDYDFVYPGKLQQDALFRARTIWSSAEVEVPEGSHRALLRNEKGEFLPTELDRLLRERDDTPLYLAE